MRPIKEIQDATHFKKVVKQDLITQGLLTDDEDEEDEDEDSEVNKKGIVWMPVCTDPKSEDYNPYILEDNDVRQLDLLQISEKRIFVRKANLKDFNKSVRNCKPTVNECFLELYAKFLQKYGHEDQQGDLAKHINQQK